MTTRERFARMHAHQEADRVPITDVPWDATIERWQREGMPHDTEFVDFFGLDRVVNIHPDNSPRFPARVREETDEYVVQTTRWGGTERMLIAMAEQPEWCVDMFHHFLDVSIALLDMVWDAGYTFDCVTWPDDMGYKQHQFFSLNMYRELLKPVQARAVAWAHAKGIPAHLHSCGDVNPLVPELLDIGIDALNPLEVKAGMDPLALKRLYGDKLVLHGGVNAVLWNQPAAIQAEMERVMPGLKQGGGYIFSSDHSVPSSVGLEDFRAIIACAKRLGSYA